MKFILFAIAVLVSIQTIAQKSPDYYDTVKIVAQVYIISKQIEGGNLFGDQCFLTLVRGWEVRRWFSDPDDPGVSCINCKAYPHHSEYLGMNRFNTLDNVWDFRYINW